MIKLHRALMAGALLALASIPAQAASIQGSLSLSGFKVTQTGTGLNLVTAATTNYAGSASGDFAPIDSSATPNFSTNTVDVSNLGAFTFSSATFGSFSVTGVGSGFTILSHTSTLLDIYFIGTFTPGAGLAPAGPGLASARVTINNNSGALTEGIAISAPPSSVPEPASIAMAGIGLAAAGLVRVLRKRSV